MRIGSGLVMAMVLAAQAGWAEVPKVAADIAPVQSLVARVMEGLGAPALIVRPGASPHAYAMRPSEAAALQEADLVVWMGEGLTPWLAGPVDTLPGSAVVLELLEHETTRRLDWREEARFDGHDHGHDDPQEHDDHGGHDDHGDDGDDHDHEAEHDHGAFDPHAWLDPENAARWLEVFAGELAALDPGNAALYHANARDGQAELAALSAELTTELEPVPDHAFIVFHDAYHYFEARFGLHAAGAVSLGDAAAPGAARIAELREMAGERGVKCALSEPQFDPALLEAVLGEGMRLGVIDPLGSALEPGPALYPRMLRDMARAIRDCTAP